MGRRSRIRRPSLRSWRIAPSRARRRRPCASTGPGSPPLTATPAYPTRPATPGAARSWRGWPAAVPAGGRSRSCPTRCCGSVRLPPPMWPTSRAWPVAPAPLPCSAARRIRRGTRRSGTGLQRAARHVSPRPQYLPGLMPKMTATRPRAPFRTRGALGTELPSPTLHGSYPATNLGGGRATTRRAAQGLPWLCDQAYAVNVITTRRTATQIGKHGVRSLLPQGRLCAPLYSVRTYRLTADSQQRHRVRVFVDFWNYTLSMRDVDQTFATDWAKLGPELARAAVAEVEATATGEYQPAANLIAPQSSYRIRHRRNGGRHHGEHHHPQSR